MSANQRIFNFPLGVATEPPTGSPEVIGEGSSSTMLRHRDHRSCCVQFFNLNILDF
jgi:hypothetical protein